MTLEPIVAPIRRTDHGAAVQNLQDALLALAGTYAVDAGDDRGAARLDALRREHAERVYRDATVDAVARFQREQRARFVLSDDSGAQVDEATAAALNRVLRSLAMLERAAIDVGVIAGRVELEDGSPAVGVRVRAFDRDLG